MFNVLVKAISKETQDWVYGYYVNTGDVYHYVFESKIVTPFDTLSVTTHEVYPETVCVFTGKCLDDHKLYVNDIILTYEDYDDIFGYPATNEFKSIVIWDEENFCFALKTDDRFIQPFNDWDWEYSSYVGNVYDNYKTL